MEGVEQSPGAGSGDPPSRKNIVLAEDGDVVLALPEESYIRVSSVLLSYASPVFKALLGPNFKEGQAERSAEYPKEIAMPDDDAEVMQEVCKILHYHSFGSEKECSGPKPSYILKVAVVADKYGCTTAIKRTLEAFLRRHAQGPYMVRDAFTGDYALAATAYLLDLANLFEYFTKRLLLNHTQAYSTLMKSTGAAVLPTSVLLGLEERRTTVRRHLDNSLGKYASGRCHTELCFKVSQSSAFNSNLAAALKTPYWPPPSRYSLGDLFTLLKDAPDVPLNHVYPCQHDNPVRLSAREIRDLRIDLELEAHGLCMECARRDETQLRCKHRGDHDSDEECHSETEEDSEEESYD